MALILLKSTNSDLLTDPATAWQIRREARQVGSGRTLPFLSVQAIRNLYLLVEMSRATPRQKQFYPTSGADPV
jgi:hypothetical protein